MRNGTQQAVRTLLPTGSFKMTRLGRVFFRNKYSEYIAHVPFIIRGTRRNGNIYEREDYLPANVLGAQSVMQNDGLSEQDKLRSVKQQVLEQFSVLRSENGRTVIHEESDEVYLLDRDREWTISSMSMHVVNDVAVTETRMRQPLGVLRSACTQLPFYDQILDQAFEDHGDKLCVPRQLAVLLRQSLEETCTAFDNICDDGWRLRGVTPEEILEFCKFHGCPMFYVAGGQMQATYDPPHKLNRAVAFTSWEDHAFLYKTAKPIANLTGKTRQVVATDTKKTLPPFEYWQERKGQFESGYFTAPDLMAVRREFLQSGRNPKISLRNLAEYSQLSYRCSKTDGNEAGMCVVRERPPDADEITEWLKMLPIEIEYNGERLAAITLKVFLTLMKSERIYLDSSQ
jgi:hypothetical protein